MWRHLRGQSLVELALVAPILAILLVIVFDLGRIFSVWITVTHSAREAAYFGSRSVAGAIPDATVRTIAATEGGGARVLADPTHVVIAYPSPDLIAVTVRAPFEPLAPWVGALWAGGPPWVSAKAAFQLPMPTSTPRPITPSTPVPPATPTSTVTPTGTSTAGFTSTPAPTPSSTSTSLPTLTRTPTTIPTGTLQATSSGTATRTVSPTATVSPTRTATPTRTPGPCTETINLPPLDSNNGYWVTFTTAGAGNISASWSLPARNNIALSLYGGNPFTGQPNPVRMSPPSGAITSANANTTSLSIPATGRPAGTHAVYFYNQGNLISSNSTGTITYARATCP